MEKNGNHIVDKYQPKIEVLKIDTIEEAFYNPRKMFAVGSKKYEDLKRSMERFGIVEPLVVNDFNNRLISGHQRLAIMKDTGVTESECTIVHIEDMAEEKALNVSLNKISSTWDKKKLGDVLSDIDDEFNALDLGFEEKDIDEFLRNDSKIDEEAGTDVGEEKATRMDSGISLKTDAAKIMCSFEHIKFFLTPEEMKEIEQELISAGYYGDKAISDALKQRFLCQI